MALKLSGELQQAEANIKRLISNRLSRGRVDVSLQYDRTNEINYELNKPLIAGYLAAMKNMQDEFSLSGQPDLNVIARLPNVLVPKKDDLGEEFVAGVERALTAALDDLGKMRENEGRMLKNEMTSRLDEIGKRLSVIESASGTIGEEYRQRLTKRIASSSLELLRRRRVDEG